MKFPVQDKVVTVCGEEEFMVSHLTSFRYVEVEGEIHETPFQAFETVQVIKAPRPEVKKTEVSISSWKDAKTVVEAGHPEGWGRVLDLPPKLNKFGVGFTPGLQGVTSKDADSFKPVKFSSAGLIKDAQANAIVEDADSDYDMDEWIRPSVPGVELNN